MTSVAVSTKTKFGSLLKAAEGGYGEKIGGEGAGVGINTANGSGTRRMQLKIRMDHRRTRDNLIKIVVVWGIRVSSWSVGAKELEATTAPPKQNIAVAAQGSWTLGDLLEAGRGRNRFVQRYGGQVAPDFTQRSIDRDGTRIRLDAALKF